MNERPNRKTSNHQDRKPFLPSGLWYIVATGIGLFSILYYLSRAFSITTEKYTFLVLGGANILIFAAILLQALIYSRQWAVMQEQRDITTIAERAYLGIKDVSIRNPIMNNTLFISGIIFNGGRTPALRVERKFQIGLVQEPRPFDWDACIERADFSSIPGGVPRRVSFPELPFSLKEFADFEAGTRSIHVDGEFRFTDFMGVRQIFAFGMVCHSTDNGDFRERYQRQYDNPN